MRQLNDAVGENEKAIASAKNECAAHGELIRGCESETKKDNRKLVQLQ